MRIVQICPYDMARPGGVQSHVRDLAAWLRRAGHEVRVVAPRPLAGQLSAGVDVCGRARSVAMFGTRFEVSLARAGELRTLSSELLNWGAEVVHLHTPWTPLMAWQLWRRLDLPTVTTFHATLPDPDANGFSGRVLRRAARHFMNRSRAVVVPSKAPLAHLRPEGAGANTHILPPSVDLGAWREAGRVHETRPSSTARLEIGFLGRFEARKGLDVLLDAWPTIAGHLPHARLTVAGGGAMLPNIRDAMAKQCGERIRLVENPDDSAARDLVAGWDIFAAPAPYGESFGLVLVEAMAAGALPVAAANAGYASVLGAGEGAGLLVPPGDVEAFAMRVVGLALAPGRRRQLVDWTRRRAEAFDMPAVGPRFLEIYRAALSPSG